MAWQKSLAIWGLSASLGAGCVVNHYVVRSSLTPLPAPSPSAEAQGVKAPIDDLHRLALVPWAGCDTDATESCSASLSVIERALLTQGFEVIAWQALRDHAARHDITLQEAAQTLHVPYLLRVHAPAVTPLSRGSFTRSYFAANEDGSVGAPLSADARLADRLDIVAARAEEQALASSPAPGSGSSQTFAFSLERASGELLFCYESRASEPSRALTVQRFVTCRDGTCHEAGPAHVPDTSRRPPRASSTRQLITHVPSRQTLERVATELAVKLTQLH
jgi:hypothetical protein